MLIELDGGATVRADLQFPKQCSKCQKEIWWAETAKGKYMPISRTEQGTFQSHFADCPFSKYFRKKYDQA